MLTRYTLPNNEIQPEYVLEYLGLLTTFIFSRSPVTRNTSTTTYYTLFLTTGFTTISFIFAQTSILHI